MDQLKPPSQTGIVAIATEELAAEGLEVRDNALHPLESMPESTPGRGQHKATWFKPGNRMNPDGRKAHMRKIIHEVMVNARGYAPEMLSVLRRIALNPQNNNEHRIKAASAVLDRAYGPINLALQLFSGEQATVGGPGSTVNVQVNTGERYQLSEVERMKQIASILSASGALRVIQDLSPEPKPVVPDSTRSESVDPTDPPIES